MQRTEIIERLREYLAKDVLGGKDIGLDETTPLLEWGIINSLEIVRLLAFIHRQFGIDLPPAELNADNFTNLPSIADMVVGSTLSSQY